ncbi:MULTISPECIES: hypothetical protein [Inquilinus]|jgi:hypothetical protein|uniref:Uncharacterized protein n=1 Tax=Inquilinus ginsengisoli TaxID=363840 RepID=A0ABU1JWT5_9PROT|nr:hypothetical protein [Inquilinus ginsengisoli]MDR6293087.1 hypothetical protein [Inquilinus ginsengisoli]
MAINGDKERRQEASRILRGYLNRWETGTTPSELERGTLYRAMKSTRNRAPFQVIWSWLALLDPANTPDLDRQRPDADGARYPLADYRRFVSESGTFRLNG